MNISTIRSAATASSSVIPSAENSDDPNVKPLASSSLTKILNGVLGTIPGNDQNGGGVTGQVDQYGQVQLGDTGIIPDGSHQVSTEGAYSEGVYSAYGSGGVWGSSVFNASGKATNIDSNNVKPASTAELANLKEVAQPQLQHPENLKQSQEYALELAGGKTVQDLIGNAPTTQQQGDMQDAFELLGVSNRQISAYAGSAYKLGADSYLNNLSGKNRDPSYQVPLEALKDAGRIRAAVDADGTGTMKNYLYKNPDVESALPDGLSTSGMINAVKQGVEDSGNYSWTSLRDPKSIAREMILGGGAEFGSSNAMFPAVNATSFATRVQQGRDLLATTKVAAKVPEAAMTDSVALQPTTPADIAQTALTMGSSVQDVYGALSDNGAGGMAAIQAIGAAYDSMGVSDAKLGTLAQNAKDDIADIGGADNLPAYFNDPTTAGQHADLDELLAGLQGRYEFDDYAQQPGSTNSAPYVGFQDARDAVSDVLGADTTAKLPVGLATPEPGATSDAAPNEGFIMHDEFRRRLESTGANGTANATQNVSESNDFAISSQNATGSNVTASAAFTMAPNQTATAANNTTASNQTAAANNVTASNQAAAAANSATASNQTAASNNTTQVNETAIAAHNASGIKAGQANGTLALTPAQNVTIAPDLLNSTALSAPFTGTPPTKYTVDDVNKTVTSAEAIASGINGTVTANLLTKSGVNGTLPSNADISAMVDQALQDKGVNATRQQIATGLTSAMLSPAYQQWLKQQPTDANQGALATLQLFNQTDATTVDNHNQLNATLSPTAQKGLRGTLNSTSPAAAAANIPSQDKAAAGLTTAQIAIGALRYTNSAFGKVVNLKKLMESESADKLKQAGTAITNFIQRAQTSREEGGYGVDDFLNTPQGVHLSQDLKDIVRAVGNIMSEQGWFKKLGTGMSVASTVLATGSLGVRAARLAGMTDPVNQASTAISLIGDMLSVADPANSLYGKLPQNSVSSLYGKLPENWRNALGQASAYVGKGITWMMAKAGINGASDIPGTQFLGSVLKNGGDTSNLLYASAAFGSLRNFATEGFNYRDTYNTIRSVVDASSFGLWAANKKGLVSDQRMNQIRFGTATLSALLAFIAAGNP